MEIVVIHLKTMISRTKIIAMLEIGLKGIASLNKLGKTAGIVLFVFYHFAENFLLDVCISFSRNTLAFIHFERAADFGGCLFLGICFLIFSSVYLFSLTKLGLIENEHKEKLTKFLRKMSVEAENRSCSEPSRKKNKDYLTDHVRNHRIYNCRQKHPERPAGGSARPNVSGHHTSGARRTGNRRQRTRRARHEAAFYH
jgi:hypothetical protein